MELSVRYAKSADGVNIAYSAVGSGPPLDKVTRALWNHVEAWWRIAISGSLSQLAMPTLVAIGYDFPGADLSHNAAAVMPDGTHHDH